LPHITIEYSANLAEHHDIQSLVGVVHAAALAHGLPPADGLRTRAVAREHYEIADGSDDLAYVAIAVRIGPGREAHAKRTFIEQLLDAAAHHLARTDSPLAIAWSIELQEIDPNFRINRNHVRTRLAERQPDTGDAT